MSISPGKLAALARIQSLHAALEKIESLTPSDVDHDPSLLQPAIGAALAPEAPGGSPAHIHSAATAYGKTAEQYDQMFQDLQKVRITKLPASWKRLTAHAATQQIQTQQIQIENTVAVQPG